MLAVPDNAIIKLRAKMLSTVRDFFEEHGILEADCSILLKKPTVDANIKFFQAENFYLPISPEFSLKKLLAQGLDSIYYLGHVFRKEELGALHCQEFTMIEWYRKNISFNLFIKECISLIVLFLGPCKVQEYSYFSLLEQFCGIKNYEMLEKNALVKLLRSEPSGELTKDELLILLMDEVIRTHFKEDALYVIYDYPIKQSLFAKHYKKDGRLVAKRFEIYYRDIELLNGCHELSDANELRKRLKGLTDDIDELFLSSLDGIGNCYGAAAGFDRLLMLKGKKNSIHDVIYS
jgi:lysyl-tRNA synthetase class 2